MIDLSIHNFRGLSRIRLVDDSPLSIIIGPNQSGKSSLAQAVGFAFCGMVNGISDSSLLAHHGHADLRVRLNLPGWTIERSLARGPKLAFGQGLTIAAITDAKRKKTNAIVPAVIHAPSMCIKKRPG